MEPERTSRHLLYSFASPFAASQEKYNLYFIGDNPILPERNPNKPLIWILSCGLMSFYKINRSQTTSIKKSSLMIIGHVTIRNVTLLRKVQNRGRLIRTDSNPERLVLICKSSHFEDFQLMKSIEFDMSQFVGLKSSIMNCSHTFGDDYSR